MTKLHDIPVVVQSGQKYLTKNGLSAIKDGIKASSLSAQTKQQCTQFPEDLQSVTTTDEATDLACAKPKAKPSWLRMKHNYSPAYAEIKKQVDEKQLATVCEEAKCPNITECWSHGTATIMLMGEVCTRACRFCAVDTGNPRGWLDLDEPFKAATTVELMKLDYVVLTSVNRDDLLDGGAAHYAATIREIKSRCPQIKVEALAPDFQGVKADLRTLLDSGLDVFAQNVETVERLTHPVRDKRASYWQTLEVLAFAKEYRPELFTKTSLMLGLGEEEAEILKTMDDLRARGVDILTLGQYLQPTRNHLPVAAYISPEKFLEYREIGLAKGFFEVASGPLVRSSYRADKVFKKNNLGL